MDPIGLSAIAFSFIRKMRIYSKDRRRTLPWEQARTPQDMDCWVCWIRPFLQCFGKHFLKKLTVEIDYDGRVETGTLVKECLSHGYREVR
jgi:hypothetical protein